MTHVIPAILHGAVLSIINLGSIIVGFAVAKAVGTTNHLAVQLPAAVLLSVSGFTVWMAAAAHLPMLRNGSWTGRSVAQTYVVALLLAPAVFGIIHYATQGYVTSLGNILALWFFQAPVNLVAIGCAQLMCRRVPPG